ncbi:hypothetical protein E2562_024680 [Oryza meyeriana var. granulata]|uniref:Uncharacterized protein n=1 Tax=Oryza meyeriana var. granulata TaxID=110450 RepID=A0A6G1EBJ0_9ORYZ|nr:hypothetical protein E2562_024680 [Oryza meyeriana var. granulata]
MQQQQPSVSLAPNTSHPQHGLPRAGSASSRRSSLHLAVHVGHPHRCHPRALCAAPNFRSHEAISAKNTNQDARLGVRKFFELEMSVRDGELDQYGVVNNAVYPTYIERAREELMSSLAMSRTSIACTGNAMALTELTIKYFTPLKRGDKFVVKLTLGRIKGVRIYIEQFIERLPDRKLVVESTATIVCLNRKQRPTRVFPELSAKLLDFFSPQEI